jgi:pyruvate/2-oxoglutarate dehydrogenase complex dihydrolipoamide acyltransferase (E2) component
MENARFLGALRAVGDRVEKGDPLLEVETDKAQVTVDAPASGYLRAVVARVGETYPVGAVLAYLTDLPDEPLGV